MNLTQAFFAGLLLLLGSVSAAQDCSSIAGDWGGNWTETDCFGDPYAGDWTAVISNSCDFTGGDVFGEINGTIEPLTGELTASQAGTECGTLMLTGTFQNDSASGSWTYTLGGGGIFAGNRIPTDTDGDGDPDVTDPDDDNDGIGDALDALPLTASNLCTGGDGNNAVLAEIIVADLTCAASNSIDVQGSTQVLGPPAQLLLIAPLVGFQSGFSAGALRVVSADPCPGCST